jgi:hypothetical protein
MATHGNESLALQNLTAFWKVQPDNGVCLNSSTVSLWFIAFSALSATWTILLGSRDFRGLLSRIKYFPPFERNAENTIFCITGSISIHVSMSIVTAKLLVEGQESASLRDLWMAWTLRPLPGMTTFFVGLFDLHAYLPNYLEMILVESYYSLAGIALIGTIAQDTTKFASQAPVYLSESKHYKLGFHLMRAGSAIDMLHWIIMIFLLATPFILWLTKEREYFAPQRRFESPMREIMLGMCALRTFGGFLIWNGVILLNPGNFCPTEQMISRVTILWTFVPLADHFVRAAFMCGAEKVKVTAPQNRA